MRICFFGHRDFSIPDGLDDELILVLTNIINEDCEFYFGGYGIFDSLAYKCVSRLVLPYKTKKIFVTPYITESYLKNQIEYHKNKYDQIIYPEIENVPYKYAICARNKWIVNQSDIIICYVNRKSGGAYTAATLAKRNGKQIINLGKIDI